MGSPVHSGPRGRARSSGSRRGCSWAARSNAARCAATRRASPDAGPREPGAKDTRTTHSREVQAAAAHPPREGDRRVGEVSPPRGGCWTEFTELGTLVGAPAGTSSVNLKGARGRRGGFRGFRGQRPPRSALLGDRLPGDARRQARLLRPHGAETAQRRLGRAHEPRGPGRDLVTPGSGNPVGWAAPS